MTEQKHIVLSTGFECDIQPDFLDDMEVIELLGRIKDGDITALPDYLKKMLGEEGKKAFYEHIRETHGKVKLSVVSPLLAEILNGIGEKK